MYIIRLQIRMRIRKKNIIRMRTNIRIGIRAQRCILGTVFESCVAFRPSWGSCFLAAWGPIGTTPQVHEEPEQRDRQETKT